MVMWNSYDYETKRAHSLIFPEQPTKGYEWGISTGYADANDDGVDWDAPHLP